ncbi:ion transporter [Thalassoglobus polymorphus]|uniref:Cyclic nucleotide-gated potassium channel n=1 Tax=Thalassoglobus polymorphus TaxID=2527994 RepID=A0A517QKU7_9PLAN|nr:ion transporter [Thalassoglobus polymorphus]QDT32167.1 Cyclic nucleotide-gated potassium channel [Thalassoglobus polymorphus]
MQQKQRAAWRERLYVIIFEADTRAGQWFDICLLVAILLSVGAVSIETVEGLTQQQQDLLNAIEWGFTILFTIEYVLRLLSVRRPLNYAFSFYGIVDLISVLPTYFTPISGSRSFAVVRSFRLLRVFRIMKLIHLTSESEELARAVWSARSKIIVFLTVVLITVTISGTAMYEIERIASPADTGLPIETQFTSIPQSIYWAIVTMTTVGYGDIVPQTTPGKFVSALLILVGYSLIIVPTGFVSAEFVDLKKAAKTSNQTCPYCMAEGHLRDAEYCRKCGKPLESNESLGAT